jgi:hypothetical protein
MTCFGSKNDFCKKIGARLIRAKGQTHPGSSEIGRSWRKIQKITPKVYTMNGRIAALLVEILDRYHDGPRATRYTPSFLTEEAGWRVEFIKIEGINYKTVSQVVSVVES